MRIGFAMIAACAVWASSAHALTDQEDISVGMKTLPLLTDKLNGNVGLAVVFDPASASSKMEADSIKVVFDRGFQAPGEVKISAMLVPVGELGKLSGNKIAFLTGGLGSHFSNIAKASAASGILTMSTDLACVQANQCILGIVSKPHVDIYYSKAAAEAAKISFGQVFALLVKQL